MEREANLLRCAKLSCYSEFNRMVHAIARSGGETGFQRVSRAKIVEGSSAEYFFYTTLVSMLKQVISNNNSESQQAELQQVYQWFCTNKPLIAAKTHPNHQRPKLTLSNRVSPHQRPQTAPAALICSSPVSTHPHCPRHTHKKPHTSQGLGRPQHGFTSSYMSQSLELGQLATATRPAIHTATLFRPTASASNTQSRSKHPESSNQRLQQVSVVEVPSQNSIQGHHQQFPLTMTTLLHLAPVVAATMEWQREMRQEQAAVAISSPRHTTLLSTPVPVDCSANDDSDGKEIFRTAPAKLRSKLQSLTPQPPNTIRVAPTPSNPPPHTVSSQLPVHVVTLTPPPPHNHTTVKCHRPFALKKNGTVKAASGFNCSRYRQHSANVTNNK